MTMPTIKSEYKTYLYYALIILIAVVGVYLRLSDIECDPPLYFTGYGQSLSTDAHHYSYFARNKILFDRWELFDSARWRVFEVTLVSGLSYLLFSLFGVSRQIANSPGLIFSLLSIFLFVFTLKDFLNRKAIILLLFLLLFNKTLFVFGRLPYTENGMIFLMVLIFYLFVRFRQNLYGQILLGLFSVLAAVAGKIFGILILAPILLTIWFEAGEKRNISAIVILSTSIITAAIWFVAAYGTEIGLLLNYYQSQTVGIYGGPEAFESPIRFVEKLISFGNDARFYYNAPAVGLAGILGFLIFLHKSSRKMVMENIPFLFMIIWFTVGQLAFMPENYRPLRYIYMLYFPLGGIAAYGLTLFDKDLKLKSAKSRLFYIVLFFVLWIFIDQLFFNVFYINEFARMNGLLVWYSLPPALILTYLEWKTGWLLYISRRKVLYSSLIIICLFNIYNCSSEYIKWQQWKSFNIQEAAEDMGRILGDKAVICGPIAPTLLLENKLKGMIYAVGITDKDSEFFKKYPVTHFVADVRGSSQITEKYPELINAAIVAEYWIRDSKIALVRISGLTGNIEAAGYQLTDFEIGRLYAERKIYDSALIYIERFASKYPDNKSALLMLGNLYPILGQVDFGRTAYEQATKMYPRDFSVHKALGIYYQMRSIAESDREYLYLARKSYDMAINLNPYQADEITEIIKKISQKK